MRLEAPDRPREPASECGRTPALVETEPMGEQGSTVPSLSSGGELGCMASGDVVASGDVAASGEVPSAVVEESALSM